MEPSDELYETMVKRNARFDGRYYGLRIVGVADLFEALCWAIMGQRINLAFVYMFKRRFAESFGVHQQWAGRNYWLFPRPETIAQLHVDDLLGL